TPATTRSTTLSLHDALPICDRGAAGRRSYRQLVRAEGQAARVELDGELPAPRLSGRERLQLAPVEVEGDALDPLRRDLHGERAADRKSTRLNSSHLGISYAV